MAIIVSSLHANITNVTYRQTTTFDLKISTCITVLYVNKNIGMMYNRALHLHKYLETPSTTPKMRPSKQGWIEEHSHHIQQITTNKPSVIIIEDSIVYWFKRYQHVWNNYFGKEALNFGIRGDKVENTFYRINQSIILHHTNTVVIICGTNNLDQDHPSDITNGLICAVALLQLKHKKIQNIYIWHSPKK